MAELAAVRKSSPDIASKIAVALNDTANRMKKVRTEDMSSSGSGLPLYSGRKTPCGLMRRFICVFAVL